MKFKVEMVRKVVMAGLATVLLASCGGGTEIEAFVPQRIVAFGDEASVILGTQAAPDGRKYTVNGLVFDTTQTPPVPTTTLECAVNPVWVQVLAYNFGMAFPGCPTAGYALRGVMHAVPDTRAADISGQVDLFLAQNGPFNSKDLVTLMTGLHDIEAQYGRLDTEPGVSRDTLIAAVQHAGNEVGNQVVRITNLGAKVVVSTIYSLSLSPFATGEELAHPGEGRAVFLNQLTTEFNKALRLRLNDVADGGHAVGLIQMDELILSMAQVPSAYVLTNSTLPACNVALPACTQTTLVAGAIDSYGAYWLWADNTRLGATGQSRVAGLAVNRVRTNPF